MLCRRRRCALACVGVEDVVYDEPLLTFMAVFNTTVEQPLVVEGLDFEKWNARYQGVHFHGYEAAVAGFDRIYVTVQAGAAEAGADAIVYTNDPSDVSDTLGRELGAFEREM